MNDFFIIRVNDRFQPVLLQDIIYVLSSGHYVKIFTTRGIYLPYLRLRDVEDRLPRELFARINRRTIVNLKRVTHFDLNTIVMDKLSFDFSDSFRQELLKHPSMLVWKRLTKERIFKVNKELVKTSLS